jgi:hypothetical protein
MNYTKLVTSQTLIDAINQIALSEERQETMPLDAEETRQSAVGEELELMEEAMQVPEGTLEQTLEEPVEETQVETIQEAVQEIEERGKEPEVEGEKAEEVEDDCEIAEEVSEEGQGTRTRSERLVMKPSRFLAVTKVSAEEWKDVENAKAIKIELRMLFEELKALRPVRRATIKGGTKILRSHMFLVEKYLADGTFDKIKARLVADGRDQDATMYPNKASPTVAIHLVFTALGVMMSRPWLIVVKIDVKEAFVQTPMEGEPVYMRVDKKISKHVVEEFPELKVYVEDDGCIYTVIKKAMYGCVQASLLWYKLLRKVLEGIGYEASETDSCVSSEESPTRCIDGSEFFVYTCTKCYRRRPEKADESTRVHHWYGRASVQNCIRESLVYVGETLVYFSSKKQKCMSKSPMEAELIGLTDNLGLVELFKEFVEFVVGHEVQVPIVYQDCKAVLSLVTKGGGITRTKHLRARMNLGREMVEENRVMAEYKKAEEMRADGFSKPLDPSDHHQFMCLLHN